MKWLLCGLTFALAVGLAIATAAIRAGNTLVKRQIEEERERIEWRRVERQRLHVLALNEVTPERLAQQLRALAEPASTAAPAEASPWQ
jgi:hypothetical protein